MGYAELGTMKNAEDCRIVADQIANDIANEKNDAARAILVKTKKRYTDKLWRFENPGGLGGTVNTTRKTRTNVAPVLAENQIIVDVPVCDDLTRITVAQMIREFAAQIDPVAVRLAQMIADRKILDAQIAAAQKTAKTKTAKTA